MQTTAANAEDLDSTMCDVPLYTTSRAAVLLAVPLGTLRTSTQPPTSSSQRGRALVTTLAAAGPRGPRIPFVGLVEGYVVAALRAAGASAAAIRAWVWQHEISTGSSHVLASEGLRAALSHRPPTAEIKDLPLRIGAALDAVTYERGWSRSLALPGFSDVVVTVDPFINGGQPTLARLGVRTSDILGRLYAGEPARAVAEDYRLDPREVSALLTWAC